MLRHGEAASTRSCAETKLALAKIRDDNARIAEMTKSE
jgi:hypothetical protein